MKQIIEIPDGNKTVWKDVKERVKTFDDAVVVLGNDNQAVIDYYAISGTTCAKDILAFAKLRVIAEALNEGWKPTFDDKEYRYYTWFYIYTEAEYDELNEDEKKECHVAGPVYMKVDYVTSHSYPFHNSRIALKTTELAKHCGKQFIDIWADFLFS